ncbi:magnesium-translocating P-type ATPase [Leptospira stimsonii]|uniref:Magnesium-transporting ATPase, P-type 1 n=1 Tax=Leptospira stimsonii TaxID=2202203 RepID=A0A4R9KYK0_9LEPT|nr:magnesium-translocating P-type ATPase [Leptospira stimsonii]RHX86679.1 magnesium-translocating P-type ATPase [Leptospira stimsonii]TGK13333.1 magnesium-translocating P-type ATPase [Leptospira stimsonii]TGM09111.1 magnesium-translocating P-type ATPase [Leptospira stimsonii]
MQQNKEDTRNPLFNFWNLSPKDCLDHLETNALGLSESEAKERIFKFGANRLTKKKESGSIGLFFSQFKSPIILLLFFAAGLSIIVRDSTDAMIILGIVLISGVLGFWQELGAKNAVAKLIAMVQVKVSVYRDHSLKDVSLEDVVPGDILRLTAGDVIPADCLLLESKDLFVNEATLTGETYPAEKNIDTVPKDSGLSKRTNSLWMGTHVISGEAKAIVVRTGKDTEFGKISERLKLRPPENEFETGVRKFGFFLLHITLLLVIAIFVINVLLGRSVLDSFLFSLALAVGLTPQLLPAIISINLSHGAKKMAEKKVIVKRLTAIENFGNMNIICSDKTGTLTEGTVKMESAMDIFGNKNETVALYAFINASFETGFVNAIDESIRNDLQFEISEYKKEDEIPYDFIRKCLSIVVSHKDEHKMITKGALTNILSLCSFVQTDSNTKVPIDSVQEQILAKYEELSAKGYRILGLAVKDLGESSRINKLEEMNMIFLGLLSFYDPPKPNVNQTIAELNRLGVSLKVITGDNRFVAASLCSQIGLKNHRTLCGPELSAISDEALTQLVGNIDVFAEIEPNSKERIIIALKKAGNVVGYIGDGINDVSALHSADVGISVETAVDVAKNAADIVLLEKDLEVLVDGVQEGRVTFANTLKYVFMATSANFGNMFSMAGVSLFLPFLPLLPKQILLTNFLTDFPEMTIATDRVDLEMVSSPKRWDIVAIRKFMIVFGLVSSFFDYMTFGILQWVLQVSHEQFRTGWFIESVVSASLIVLVIRTRNPFYKSRPSKPLLFATLSVIAITLAIPYTPIAEIFGLVPLPLEFMGLLFGIILLYISVAEIAKRRFYKKVNI